MLQYITIFIFCIVTWLEGQEPELKHANTVTIINISILKVVDVNTVTAQKKDHDLVLEEVVLKRQ